MGEIYRNACIVLVWLGNLDDDLRDFFKELRNVVEASSMNKQEPEDPPSPLSDGKNMVFHEGMRQYMEKLGPTGKLRLQRHTAVLYAAPYWTRVWIAQGILVPRAFGACIFDGDRFWEMPPLQPLLTEITNDSQADDRFKSLCREYLWWRNPVFMQRRANQDSSLSSLLSQFDSSGCQDPRDRIFALLSLAEPRPLIKVDYKKDRACLFREILGQSLQGKAIDDVLALGAKLIDALELPQGPVAPLVWANSTLRFPDLFGTTQRPYREQPTVCLFVGIFDGSDTHVFEYAVGETSSAVFVRYARAYDHMQGTPKVSETANTFKHKVVRFLWLDRPSEVVYYFRGGFNNYSSLCEPFLAEWKRPLIEIPGRESSNIEPPQMLPANRLWKLQAPFLTIFREIKADIFYSPEDYIHDILEYIKLHGGSEPHPTTSRPCTHRYVLDEEQEQDKEQVQDEE
ncbi:hypothetical protein EK21DRAFT_92214 [Setomelanomma holmii]|uniref:Heterokaryon incompatibility domain-containing protein n=1 Tax=Setomelanomma holmii TaxID=210430 RepID=A0A9P4H2X3_9PLEO|nr:hypothetical protein EK21DRAFT_92214 [Setomelanomma holmii]